MVQYSAFLQTLHDEPGPTGYLGRGTHYSILRGLTWHDQQLQNTPEAFYHDFAVIWDEDHDLRVISVVESLQRKGLLSPVVFIGERKAMVTIVTGVQMPATYTSACEETIRSTSEVIGDIWDSSVIPMASNNLQIISANDDDVRLYLSAIKMLWRLGCASGTPL